jgi:hypothetical protein
MPTVHVYPLSDATGHVGPEDPQGRSEGWLSIAELPGEQFDDCPCGPSVEPVPADDGSMGWLVTHHSLDGRELTEVGDA